jgi:uncharacterized membrane protein
MMTKEEYLALAAEKYEALKKLQECTNFYDYEKTFDEIWVDLGRNVLEKSLGGEPKNHRKKTKSEPGTGK